MMARLGDPIATPSPQTAVALNPAGFAADPCLIASRGRIAVRGFRYPSGVVAIEIVNAVGQIIVLPFQGQQIWDARFFGRRLTMQSPIATPLPTRDYVANYGAFFIHCGGTAMGNPGPGDDHPLHGELPNLPMTSAVLDVGRDGDDDWVSLHSHARVTTADGHVLDVRPALRLTGQGSTITISVDVGNAGTAPLPFFYLAHANFRPMDGAVIAGPETRSMIIRNPTLPPDAADGDRRWHTAVARDPARHAALQAGDRVVPEFVGTFAAPGDADGWVETRQIHPDGRCDLLHHNARDLPLVVRWMVRSDDRQALGFALPATAAPDGRAAALRNGQAVMLAPGQSFRTTILCGAEDRIQGTPP